MTRPARWRSTRRCRWRARCPATAGCSGSPRARPSGPVEALLAAVRGTVYARATAQDAGYGLETELAEPDPALVEAAAPAVEALEHAAPPAGRARQKARGGDRGRARLARRAGARPGRGRDRRPLPGACRPCRPGSRWRRGSAGRPIPISSTGWRSSGSRAANMMPACTATGSIRPGRSPKRC